MAFNFKRAAEVTEATLHSKALGAIVLGPSGGGKSFLMGTSGLRTLYLYTLGEDHGPNNARASGGELVVPVCVNYDSEGKLLVRDDGTTPDYDSIYRNVREILGDGAGIKEAGFELVVVDGLPELEAIVRGTSDFVAACRTNKGGHNTFQEPTAVNDLLRPILNSLKDLQRSYGLHFAVTCTIDVQEVGDMGEIVRATPQLSTYSVAQTSIRQFGDVLMVGRMEREGVAKHKIQFLTDVSRVSKDELGMTRKILNFNPRLGALSVEKLPPYMDADLKQILALKAGA